MDDERSRVYGLINKFLKQSNLYIGQDKLRSNLYSNPNFPGIVAIADEFENLNMELSLLESEDKEKDFVDLPDLFLALVKDYHGADRLALIQKNNTNVKVIFDDTIIQTITPSKFIESWSGIIAVLEKKTALKYYFDLYFTKVNILISMLVFGVLFWFIRSDLGLLQSLHFILGIAGLILSVLIFYVDAEINSSLVGKVCTSEKYNCNDVINSVGSTVFKYFKLSDIVVVYFVSLLCCHILFIDNPQYLYSLFSLLAFLSIPAIFYSVYYQWKILKNWCSLCLSIVFVLCLQITVLLFLPHNEIDLNLYFLACTAFLFTSIYLGWAKIRELLNIAKELSVVNIKYHSFKRNIQVFNYLHTKNPKIDTAIETGKEIAFGNKDAELQLIFIINPDCPFCKKAYIAIDNILRNYGDSVYVIFRFYLFGNDDLEIESANKMLRIYHTDTENSYSHIKQMFEGDNSHNGLNNNGESLDVNFNDVLIAQKQWCEANNINYAPAVILNQRLYPTEQYEFNDLSFFIDKLI